MDGIEWQLTIYRSISNNIGSQHLPSTRRKSSGPVRDHAEKSISVCYIASTVCSSYLILHSTALCTPRRPSSILPSLLPPCCAVALLLRGLSVAHCRRAGHVASRGLVHAQLTPQRVAASCPAPLSPLLPLVTLRSLLTPPAPRACPLGQLIYTMCRSVVYCGLRWR